MSSKCALKNFKSGVSFAKVARICQKIVQKYARTCEYLGGLKIAIHSELTILKLHKHEQINNVKYGFLKTLLGSVVGPCSSFPILKCILCDRWSPKLSHGCLVPSPMRPIINYVMKIIREH